MIPPLNDCTLRTIDPTTAARNRSCAQPPARNTVTVGWYPQKLPALLPNCELHEQSAAAEKPHGCRHTSSRRAFRCVGNISRRSPNDTSLRKAMPCKHRHANSNTNTNHTGLFTHSCQPIDAGTNSVDTDSICITTSLRQHSYDHQCDQACHWHKNTWTEHQLRQPLPTWPTLDTAAQ